MKLIKTNLMKAIAIILIILLGACSTVRTKHAPSNIYKADRIECSTYK